MTGVQTCALPISLNENGASQVAERLAQQLTPDPVAPESIAAHLLDFADADELDVHIEAMRSAHAINDPLDTHLDRALDEDRARVR